MKQPVRDLLAALVRIVNNDLDELRGNIAHVDELHSRRGNNHRDWLDQHMQRLDQHDARISELEAAIADNAQHSRKAES